MIWFYSRASERMEVESRYDDLTLEYVVSVRHPDGHQETERFGNKSLYRAWLVNLTRSLHADRWKPDDPPTFLPDGWPISRTWR